MPTVAMYQPEPDYGPVRKLIQSLASSVREMLERTRVHRHTASNLADRLDLEVERLKRLKRLKRESREQGADASQEEWQ